MKLFLDTSLILAACGSTHGASREVFRLAPRNQWELLASPYVLGEVSRNLPFFPRGATAGWAALRTGLTLVEDVWTVDRVALFPVAKDRPVLFAALAWADLLLTRDTADFERLLGDGFYGLGVLTPGAFLQRERTAGRLQADP